MYTLNKEIKNKKTIHIDRNSNDIHAILNMNNDSKSNDRNSKDELENDFRDINIFVETNLNNELNVFFDNDSDNLMKENVNLNNANVFTSNKFDDLKDESFKIFL